MATFEGFPVNMSMMPEEAKRLIPIDITTDQFTARLKEGGTITLIGTDLVLGKPSFSNNEFFFMAIDVLELRKGARIVTNGNTVSIFCNKIVSENGKIVSFLDADMKAQRGADGVGPSESGKAGETGDTGGLVSLHVIQDIEGILNVSLPGQNGGDGGNGASGAKGSKGDKGADSTTAPGGSFPWLLTCVQEAENGHKGGTGGPGGHGGNAGSGGSGGIFELTNVGDAPIADAKFTFAGSAGQPGNPGNGGTGGPGGDGGDGGKGSVQCHGGQGGPVGDQGRNGDFGQPGKVGAEGKVISKNLNLEVTIRVSTVVPANTGS